ncbi:MAG: putative Radical domain protein, partial [Gemmatimonadetes bacterium]|nr:putative Radical domain protein [Gemmatimonadota bacterium]
MPELEFSSYLDSLTRQSRRSGTPVMATFEITPACNLRCHFCYVALDPYQGPYLSLPQVEQVLDTLAKAGVLMLTLTGGEVFSRRDFAEIYRAARARGFLVTIYTNATLITEAHARLLAEEPPLGIEVSIYGADAAHYEATTGIKGSFARL